MVDTQPGAQPVPVSNPKSEPGNVTKLDSPGTQTPKSLNLLAIRALALETGFSDAGLVALPHADEALAASRFEDWIHAGRAGSMHYLTRRDDSGQLLRSRARIPFPWARSAIVCLASYNVAQPRSIDPAPPQSAWIARYAWSSRQLPSHASNAQLIASDYHKVLLKRLRTLESRLHEHFGEFESRAYVDTGPIVERVLATAAGLGWIAKNTCLINQRLGSFVFLAVLLTSLDTDQNEKTPAVPPDRCGSCTRCIDACPTDALIAPYQMDATRCISYLTIEHRGPLDEQLMNQTGRQVFGCDICQDVCPWNSPHRTPIAADAELEPRAELVNPALDWLASLDEDAFERTFNGSPVRRAGFNGLRRNIAVAVGNSGAVRFTELLKEWSRAADEGLRAAARWALGRLGSASPHGSLDIRKE
jgi:epoxyqueuosine reductase